jgi:hypothetical protein
MFLHFTLSPLLPSTIPRNQQNGLSFLFGAPSAVRRSSFPDLLAIIISLQLSSAQLTLDKCWGEKMRIRRYWRVTNKRLREMLNENNFKNKSKWQNKYLLHKTLFPYNFFQSRKNYIPRISELFCICDCHATRQNGVRFQLCMCFH